MYKTATRIVVSLIVVFMVASLVIPAFAAGDIGVGSDTMGIQVLYGVPNPAEFPMTGKYNFVIKSNTVTPSTLELWVTRPDKTTAMIVTNPQTVFTYGGLTLKAPSGQDGWKTGDKFHITIIGGEGGGSIAPIIDRSVLKDTGGHEISRILKNRIINATFEVIDPNATHASVDRDSVRVLFESGAFTRSGDSTTVVKLPDNSSSGKATFLVDLNDLKYTGKGNTIKFTVLYTAGGKDYSATVVHTATECVEYKETLDPDDPDNEDKIDPLTPYIIVENYTYGGTNVTAGNEFTLRVTLRNTSETHSLQNIKMSVSPKGVFSMVSSSNTFYIDSLFAGSTTEKNITLYAGLTSVTDEKDANSIGIDFDFQYVANDVRKSGSSNENITIPVLFPDRFEYTDPSMPMQVFVGEEFPIYIPFVNKGRSTIYNLSAELVGMESEQGQKLFIGNVNAGSENSIEFYVRAQMPGESSGSVLISYEDANMNLKEITVPFKVDVQEMSFPEPMEPPIDPGLPTDGEVKQGTSSKKVIMGISFVAIAAMSTYVTVQKTKLKRREWDDEAI